MSRYDGLIIPRSYSEYINKTDAATLSQALQLSGVLSGTVAAGDNKAVKSGAVNSALGSYEKRTILNPSTNYNFDNLIENGTYVVPVNYGGTLTNAPSGIIKNGGGVLETKNQNTYMTQIFYPYSYFDINGDHKAFYIRKKSYSSSDGVSWREWETVTTDIDISNALATCIVRIGLVNKSTEKTLKNNESYLLIGNTHPTTFGDNGILLLNTYNNEVLTVDLVGTLSTKLDKNGLTIKMGSSAVTATWLLFDLGIRF